MAGTLDPNVVPGTSFLVDCFKDKKKIKTADVSLVDRLASRLGPPTTATNRFCCCITDVLFNPLSC